MIPPPSALPCFHIHLSPGPLMRLSQANVSKINSHIRPLLLFPLEWGCPYDNQPTQQHARLPSLSDREAVTDCFPPQGRNIFCHDMREAEEIMW